MPRYIAARVDEIPEGGRKIVELGGRSIGVFNIGGDFFALLNHCPHAGAALCKGVLSGIATAEGPGVEVRYERRGEFIRCPWHQWEFDIKTGQSWFDPKRLRVRPYTVEVVPGSPEALIDEGGADRQTGPFVAEGYGVDREGEYVVVDTDRRRPAKEGPRTERPGAAGAA